MNDSNNENQNSLGVGSDRIAELARDFVWEPENYESYERCKGTSSFSLPVEWFELCAAIEEKYGAMPLEEPCDCGAKTYTDHTPGCADKPDPGTRRVRQPTTAMRCGC